MNNSPRICSIHIKDFRGIADLDLDLDSSLTVIAGRNGAGKTTVLEAIVGSATAVGDPYFGTGSRLQIFQLPPGAVRGGAEVAEAEICLTLPDDARITLKAVCKESYFACSASQLRDLLLEQRPTTPSPIIYYGQNRISNADSSMTSRQRIDTLDAGLRSVSAFKEWFFEKEGDEAREAKDSRNLDYSDPDLDVVRDLLGQMEGFRSIRSRLSKGGNKRVLYVTKHQLEFPFDAVSSGEKAIFVLAVDLARRLTLKYPKTELNKCPALVLIDEIELHLHPGWQRKILDSLTHMFPACQFVVTTHSPQVIGGVHASNIRLLSLDESGVVSVKVPSASKGRDSNYILHALLDTTDRDSDVSGLFFRFDELVDAGEFGEAEEILDQIEKSVEGGSSRVSARRVKLRRRQGSKQ